MMSMIMMKMIRSTVGAAVPVAASAFADVMVNNGNFVYSSCHLKGVFFSQITFIFLLKFKFLLSNNKRAILFLL